MICKEKDCDILALPGKYRLAKTLFLVSGKEHSSLKWPQEYLSCFMSNTRRNVWMMIWMDLHGWALLLILDDNHSRRATPRYAQSNTIRGGMIGRAIEYYIT